MPPRLKRPRWHTKLAHLPVKQLIFLLSLCFPKGRSQILSQPPPYTSESERFNALNLNYSMVGKLEGGARGAYLVKDGQGVDHIFKAVSADDITAQISRSAQAAAAVNSISSLLRAAKPSWKR